MSISARRARLLRRLAAWVSAIIFLVVVLMRRFRIETAYDFGFLPALNAGINSVTAVLLIAARIAIRYRKVHLHKRLMTSALVLSALFLVSYVTYHLTMPETVYSGTGIWRVLYIFVLVTHIVLAAVILPLILFTYIRALEGRTERHRRMARWVFPLWLYVVVTGPLIYVMLYL